MRHAGAATAPGLHVWRPAPSRRHATSTSVQAGQALCCVVVALRTKLSFVCTTTPGVFVFVCWVVLLTVVCAPRGCRHCSPHRPAPGCLLLCRVVAVWQTPPPPPVVLPQTRHDAANPPKSHPDTQASYEGIPLHICCTSIHVPPLLYLLACGSQRPPPGCHVHRVSCRPLTAARRQRLGPGDSPLCVPTSHVPGRALTTSK